MIHRLWAASIWHPDAIPLDEWKYRNLKRVLLPIVDVFLIWCGVWAGIQGIPAIDLFFTDWVSDSFSYVFTGAAMLALIGVAFPRLWWVEAGAKIVLSGLLASYLGALMLLTLPSIGSRGFISGLAGIALGIVTWRLSLLGGEWAQRRNEGDE